MTPYHRVELATAQIGRADPPARIANGNNLAVCRRVKQGFLLTAALADDLALPDNDRRKWTRIFRAQTCTADFDCARHEFLGSHYVL